VHFISAFVFAGEFSVLNSNCYDSAEMELASEKEGSGDQQYIVLDVLGPFCFRVNLNTKEFPPFTVGGLVKNVSNLLYLNERKKHM
jgi:hypothetical protein